MATESEPELEPEPPLDIVLYPHPTLRKVAVPVTAVDDAVRARVEVMTRLMREAQGVGLAAPQVDWSVRLFLVDVTGGDLRVFINPRILSRQGRATAEEGCLSLPDIRGRVERAVQVRVAYTDLEGREVEEAFQDLTARAVQHEYDHLEGILILSRMSPAERRLNDRLVKDLEADFRARS